MTKRLLVCLLVVALLLGVTACARGPARRVCGKQR